MLVPPLRPRVAHIAGLLSGVLYAVAFAGNQPWTDRWAVAFVALVPLWIALQKQTPRLAAWVGLEAGLGMNLCGFYWLLNMLKVFSGFPTIACVFFVVVICAYQGGRLALCGWLYARAAQRGWPPALVFGAAFAASEFLYPLLFPWYFAATLHDVPSLMQTAELGGPILIGLMLVGVNVAVAEPLLARLEERPLLRRRMVVGALGLAATLLFGIVRMHMMDGRIAAAPVARVGVVQGNMGLLEKRQDPEEGLRRHKRHTRDLRAQNVDLVVWSESSVMHAVQEKQMPAVLPQRVTRELGVPLIFGAVLYRIDPDRERWFNTALSSDKSGAITGRYDKEFLLAFGEYLPLGDTFPILYKWSPHSGKFTPGTDLTPLAVPDAQGTMHKVVTLICYEDILPTFTNKAMRANPDAELMVNITNDAWFGDTAEPWEHLALAKLRSIEHRRYLVRGTNSGVSALVDPVGRLVAVSGTFREEHLVGDVRWLKGTTVYEAMGDVPWWLVSLAALTMAFRKRRG